MPAINFEVPGFESSSAPDSKLPVNADPGMQQAMAQIDGVLQSSWKNLTEFPAPGFILAKTWLLKANGE